MADGRRQAADGRRQTAGGRRQTADGRRQTADEYGYRTPDTGLKIFLYEPRAEVDVELHQRFVAGVAEAVNLPGLDDQHVTRAGLELLPIHDPYAAAALDELNLVVGV